MKKNKKKIIIDCNSNMTNMVCDLSLSMKALIALSQAIQFTLENKEDYLKIYPCKKCLIVSDELQSILSDIIELGIMHYKENLN